MWKVNVIFKGAGSVYFYSSTEPEEIFDVTGKHRLGFNYTLVENYKGGWTLGYVDWTESDIVVRWQPEKASNRLAKGVSGKKDPKVKGKAKGPTINPDDLEACILCELRDGPATELQLAKDLGLSYSTIFQAVTPMLKRGIVKISSSAFRKSTAFHARSKYAILTANA